jgi:hypothetical protein
MSESNVGPLSNGLLDARSTRNSGSYVMKLPELRVERVQGRLVVDRACPYTRCLFSL